MALSDNKPGVMGAIGNIGQVVKQGTVAEVKKTVENTVEQLSGKEKKETALNKPTQEAREKENKAMLEAMYGPSTPAKTPEEQQQMVQLKNQLHGEYYQTLTQPQKPADTEQRQKEEQEEHENTADRMARLEREDQIEDQKKQEKQQPINTEPNIEKNRGSSG